MNFKNSKNTLPKILFVCYGNTCRSPMAEGLAKKMLVDRAVVESAGLMPMFESAASDAVAVMEEWFDVDISTHRPRDIAELSLNDYERIIILDTYVYNALSKLLKNSSEKIVLWETEDPFGQDREAYERVARWLDAYLKEHLIPLLFG